MSLTDDLDQECTGCVHGCGAIKFNAYVGRYIPRELRKELVAALFYGDVFGDSAG